MAMHSSPTSVQETVAMRMPQRPPQQIFGEMQVAAQVAQQAATLLAQAIAIAIEVTAMRDVEEEIEAINDWLVAFPDDVSLPDESSLSDDDESFLFDSLDDMVEHSSTIVQDPCEILGRPCFTTKTSQSEALSSQAGVIQTQALLQSYEYPAQQEAYVIEYPAQQEGYVIEYPAQQEAYVIEYPAKQEGYVIEYPAKQEGYEFESLQVGVFQTHASCAALLQLADSVNVFDFPSLCHCALMAYVDASLLDARVPLKGANVFPPCSSFYMDSTFLLAGHSPPSHMSQNHGLEI
jgi:hypothetical protein